MLGRLDIAMRVNLWVWPAGVLLCASLLGLSACNSNRVDFEDEVVESLQKIINAVEDAGEESNVVFADGAVDHHEAGFEQSMDIAQSELTMLLHQDIDRHQVNCEIPDRGRPLEEGCRLLSEASLRLAEMRLHGGQIFSQLGWNNLQQAARNMATSDSAAAGARRKLIKAMEFYVDHMQVKIARSTEQVLRLAVLVIVVLSTLVVIGVRLVVQSRRHERQIIERDKARIEYTKRLELVGREVRRLRDLGAAIDATGGILIFNQQHKIEAVNDNFRKMRGLGQEEVRGQTIVEILGVEDEDKVEEIVNAIAHKQIWRGEIAGLCEDGSSVWMYALFYPELDDLEDFDGSLALILDITDSKKNQMTLDRTRHLTALGEMAGGIAHEINNPLSVITGRTNVLLKKLNSQSLDPAFFQSGLEQIQRTVNRIAKIVESMRRLSRSDVMSTDARPEKVDTIVREAHEFIEEKLRKYDVQFSVHDPMALAEVHVMLQGFGLAQILINLVSNAVDAIDMAGYPERWVRFEIATAGEGRIQIRVVDPGKGIPKEIRDKIMTPFFTTKPAGKGTGLGLSLSMRIAEEHGGRLYYDDAAAHTTFVLELPELKKAKEVA